MVSETPARLGRQVILALVAMAVAVFVIANDITALAVALPDIERNLDSDVDTVQWVINAYALVFGVFIVTAGRFADMFGRRRVFFIGAAVFAVFSLLGGLAPGPMWLIVARALMGFGGAMMFPSVLGMTYDVLPESRAGLAGGIVLGAAGLGNAAGPLIGGALTDAFGWRWVLFANVPVAILAVLATRRFIAESWDTTAERAVDIPGVLTLSVGLIALMVALDMGTDLGWLSPTVLALVGGCVLLLGSFVVVESRAGPRALVPPDVARNQQFRAICIAVLCMSMVFFAAVIYLPQFMQKILGWSALVAGVGLLPMMATFGVTSFFAGRFYERLGAKRVITAGALALAVGSTLVLPVGTSTSWPSLLPGMVVLGLGLGLFYSSATTAGVTVLGESRGSLAGGIVYMCQIGGGSVGLALMTMVFTLGSARTLTNAVKAQGLDLSAAETDALHGVLVGTESSQQVAARLSASDAAQVEVLVRQAFTSGLRWGFVLVTVLAWVGVAVTLLRVAGPPSALLRGGEPDAGERREPTGSGSGSGPGTGSG